MAPALLPSVEMRPFFKAFSIISSLLSIFLPKKLKVLPINPMDNCRNPQYEEYCAKDPYFQKSGVQLGTLVAMKDFIGAS